MYVSDFDLNGSVEQIICSFNGDKSYPVAMKDDLINQIPSLEVKYPKFDDYKNATIEDLFPPEVLGKAAVLKAHQLKSCVMINNGKGSYNLIPLPTEAQFAPVYAINADDFDRDGKCDIILGGNQYKAKPETGIYDASYGLFLRGSGDGTWRTEPGNSGFFIKGQIRDIRVVNIKGISVITVAGNNDKLHFYKY
jgi:hypothetical protein